MKSPIGKQRFADLETDGGEIRLADDGCDERSEQVFRERGNNRAESSADHDANRHIHHVATENELLEA